MTGGTALAPRSGAVAWVPEPASLLLLGAGPGVLVSVPSAPTLARWKRVAPGHAFWQASC